MYFIDTSILPLSDDNKGCPVSIPDVVKIIFDSSEP